MSNGTSTQRILIIDDAPREVQVLHESLHRECEVVLVTRDGAALEAALARPWDLILLDCAFGGGDGGCRLAETLKGRPETRDIPLVFLKPLDGEADEARGLALGAVDYLSKPLRLPIAAARVRNHLERRRDRQRLLRERVFLDTVLGMSGDVVIVTDDQGGIVRVNPACEALCGVRSGQLTGRPVWSALSHLEADAAARPRFMEPLAAPFGSVEAAEAAFDWRCRDGGGNPRHIAWKVARIPASETGAPGYAVITGSEITNPRAEAEQAARATQSRIAIAALLETSLEPLSLKRQLEIALDIVLFIPWLAVEFKGAIFLMNHETDLLELAAHRDLPAPLLQKCARIAMGQCLCGQAAQSREIVFENHLTGNHTITFDGMRPHGHFCVPILFREQLLGVLDLYLPHGHQRRPEEDALLTTVANTLAGIIRHRRLEGALKTEREFVSTVLGTTSALVTVLDANGRIQLFNSACERLSGYSAEEMVGRFYTWDRLLLAGEMDGVRDHLSQLASGSSPARHEHHWVTRNRRQRLISWVNTILLNPDDSVRNIIATGIDITDRREAEKKLEFLAHNDTLTGLPNRRLFLEHLNQSLARARRDRLRSAVLFMDLDRFKAVNDTYGHEIGDLLLQEAARRIQGALRETDIVARLGGDEFTVLLGGNTDAGTARRIAGKIIEALCQPFPLKGHDCRIGSSIGISVFPDHDDDPEALLKKADTAMYAVKRGGRNACLVYDPTMAEMAEMAEEEAGTAPSGGGRPS